MSRYLLFLLLFGISTSFAQQAAFDKPYRQKIGSSFDFVGTGDVNGDGLTDVAGATTFYFDPANDYKIFLWLQGAGGQLQAAVKFAYPTPGRASCFAVSDLYQDGTAEVLIGVNGRLNIYSWINNGLVLTDSLVTTANSTQLGITTADFDGDGLTDIGLCHHSGDRVTVIYQLGEATKWDIHHYSIPSGITGHVTAGKFGSLQQNALVYVHSKGQTIYAFTFTSTRNIKDKYELQPTPSSPNSVAIVKKGAGKPNELWVVFGGNSPSCKISVWRDIQTAPDTTFATYEIPEAIQSDNLDCDEDDEPVVVHGGFHKITVYTDSADMYDSPYSSHTEEDGLALGDVNNDGRIDICLATRISVTELVIFYNITSPCWPVSVENASSKKISVFPNPVASAITIKYPSTGLLDIADVRGQRIHRQSFDQKAVIDAGSWATGMYFITLRTTDGQVINSKFMRE